MSLHLHPHFTLPALAEAAATILRAPPPGDDPFATDVLVVGGRGVEQWMRLALAERLDIVANLELWSPSRFVQDLERWAIGEVPASASALTLDLLAAVQRDPSLLPPELRHLREGGEPGAAGTTIAGSDGAARADSATTDAANAGAATTVVQGLLAGWAGRMARTFERYQLHRHDWLLGWERGDAPDDWQARLWRATIAASSRTVAPATAHEITCRALLSARATTGLAPRWLLVHQGRLAPAHLALVRALATHREVHLLVHAATWPACAHLMRTAPDAPHAPSRTPASDTLEAAAPRSVPETFDASALHPVAARLDRVRVDAVRLVRRELGEVAHLVPAAEPPARHEPSRPSLLAAVQRAVQQHAPLETRLDGDAADHSLRVLACHGALRQVEVLKDALLGALNTYPTLQPRDILVLTPDPARFVPLLQAVLPLTSERDSHSVAREAVGSGTPPLLLHVQGRSPRATNPVADVLLQLLALANERVSASRVLTLVERGPVAERFAIAPGDAPLVREWFQAAGVRWGTDAHDPARAGLGLRDEGTWARGLVRVLLGTALLDEGERADTHLHGHAPVPGLEGERVLLAGRAARAIRLLLALLDDARAPRPLGAWADFVDHALALLVDPNGLYSASVTRVREVVQALGGVSPDAHTAPRDREAEGEPSADATHAASRDHEAAGEPSANATHAGPDYSASALAALLEHRLEDVLGAPGRLGGITVAPLTAGWVRPARVIALLGMDDDLFPRRGGTPWFDRLAESPRPGDPDERGEQLQTVFDALCMAQDRLLITYTGWNRAGTMPLPPSVAVSALAEAVHDVVVHAPESTPNDSWRTHVECDVPLQPFSRRAFTEAVVPSFDALAAGTATRLRRRDEQQLEPRRSRSATTVSATRRDVLPLAMLLRFLARPADEILARLGVRLGMDAPLMDDVLPLTMPRFDEAVAVTDMAHALLLGQPLHERFDALRHRDRMPPAVLGRAWQHHASGRARHLADRGRHAVHDQPRRDRVVLRVPVGDTTLTGTIDTRHGHQLLFLRDGRHATHRVLAPFVTLCFATLGDPTITQAMQLDADETIALATPPDPTALLADLIALYHDADRAVPAYAPRASFAYVAELAKSTPAEQQDPAVKARALDKARGVWTSDDPAKPGESDEPANQLLHLVSPVDEPAFATTAEKVFMPMLLAMVGP